MARAIIGGLVRHGVPGSDILVVNSNNPKSTGEVKAMYGAIPSAPEASPGADTAVDARASPTPRRPTGTSSPPARSS